MNTNVSLPAALGPLGLGLPEEARGPVLPRGESSPQTRFIIGHENSPLHGKTEFGL